MTPDPTPGEREGTLESGAALTTNAVSAGQNQATTEPPAVLMVNGEIDVATGTKLRAALATSLAAPQVEQVIADLRSVTFMSSTGIAVLMDAHAEAEASGKSLTLRTGSNRAVLNPLRMSGVDTLLRLDLAE